MGMRQGWWRFWRRAAWRGWTSDRDALRGYAAARAELPRQIAAKSAEIAEAQQANAKVKLALEWASQVAPRNITVDLDKGEIAYATVEGVSLMQKRWREGDKPWTATAEGSLHFTDRRMLFDGEDDLDFSYADWEDAKPWETGFHLAVGTRLTLAGPIEQLDLTLASVQALASGVDPTITLTEAERETSAVVGVLQNELKRLNWTLGALRKPRPPRSPAWALGAMLVISAGGGSAAVLTYDPAPAAATAVPETQPVAMAPTTTAVPVTQPVVVDPTTTTTATAPAEIAVVQDVRFELATVVSVVDGETVRVRLNDGTQDVVRLIGIDAPGATSSFSSESRDYLEELVAGREVRLVSDTSERDGLGRLLRYMYVGSRFVNLSMVEWGFAVPREDPPDTQFSLQLQQAGQAAEAATLGLWAAPLPTDNSFTTTPPLTCDTSYSGACVPAGVSDVDCAGGVGDGPYFVEGPIDVVGEDVYALDVDGDGVACNKLT